MIFILMNTRAPGCSTVGPRNGLAEPPRLALVSGLIGLRRVPGSDGMAAGLCAALNPNFDSRSEVKVVELK